MPTTTAIATDSSDTPHSSNQDVSLTISHSRPSSFRCSWRTLLNLPRRVFAPPAIPSAPRFKVRSCAATPLDAVTLESILNDSYLPPLTLVDFQDYLVFSENSVENLFYLRWLAHYASLHEKLNSISNNNGINNNNNNQRSSSDAAEVIDEMSQQYQRSLSTFILPGSAYELNLPSKLIQELLMIAPQQYVDVGDFTSTHRHAVLPPPADAVPLVQCKHAVVQMLRGSARKFSAKSPANGGRKRGWFALFVGVLFGLFGLLIVLVARLYQKGDGGRRTAGASIPFFWFGVATFVMGLHGICIVVFMFGDARQLHPIELAMAPSTLYHTSSGSGSAKTHTSDERTLGVGADAYGLNSKRSNTTTSHRSNSDDNTSQTSHTYTTPNNAERGSDKINKVDKCDEYDTTFYHEDALKSANTRMKRKFEQVPPVTTTATYVPYIDTPFVPNKPGYLKRFGTVTRHTQPKSAGVRGVFEPLTSVDEPIVSRVQLQVFYLAVVWATILAAVGGTLAIVL
ncbi:hypothetical protein E3P89_02379 [Wallemia ichthyophaga]|uniref:RGS domain-containing protein n=1 Tax=Wallemia ichthyophaga TaxID=245174 RepID=A0A4T0I1J0_WALIC|nr:hypothetical protein E3P90_02867 [Wallemia ichthyophaga]TIB12203.1 hypothetical protein E3P93_02346 [Wallemia ichthyophaga]TIB21913.1 hypothetical protein E3P89_02379 [Wallemia ichthyophaga]TIB23636.1 hypothetical protein E3P88_02470 [Wallemia ichthyophaga]